MDAPRLSRYRVLGLILPVAAVLLLAAAFLHSGIELTPESLMSYTPESPVLAVLVLWGMYALKSLSILFPIVVLFIVGGWLFPLPVALTVNTLGYFITASIPYLYGRLCGRDLVPALVRRHPKLEQLRRATRARDLALTVLMRLLGLPCDLVSLYLGAAGVPYPKYLLGCLAGSLPFLCTSTILGDAVLEPGSPQFLLSLLLSAVLLIFTFIFCRFYFRRHSK